MRYIATLLLLTAMGASLSAQTWKRHTIDQSSRGADGVRLQDVNGDGLEDIVTGWEEGGVIRAYLHPGYEKSTLTWPAVTVGKVKSPEDAVFVDLDQDGAFDVVSCCEGRQRTVFFHWAPASDEYLDESKWKTDAVPATQGKQMWMYCQPAQLDERNGPDLVVGSKGKNAFVGLLIAPREARKVADWQYQPLRQCGWIMSIRAWDVDGDNDLDMIISDRKGKSRGVFWLENPGAAGVRAQQPWKEHRLGGESDEVMFLDIGRLKNGGKPQVLVATRNRRILRLNLSPDSGTKAPTDPLPNPFQVPHGKSIAVGDINKDGLPDLVHSTNIGGNRKLPGVSWLKQNASGTFSEHNISGKGKATGVKFDLVQLRDVDGDGDLDILTCEERDGLGVFWYENPTTANPRNQRRR